MSAALVLKPCPFCGGEAEVERFGTPRVSTIYACTDCGCRLETGEEWGHGTRWNERAKPSDDLLKAMEECAEGLRDMFALVEEGFLVRNVRDDAKPDWAIKQLPAIKRLQVAHEALSRLSSARAMAGKADLGKETR